MMRKSGRRFFEKIVLLEEVRATIDSFGSYCAIVLSADAGGFGHANSALAAAKGPQIRALAGRRRYAREMHRASAVPAGWPKVTANRPYHRLHRQHRTPGIYQTDD